MKGWFDIKVRGIVGGDHKDMKEITILGRLLRYTEVGIESEGDPTHRDFGVRDFWNRSELQRPGSQLREA